MPRDSRSEYEWRMHKVVTHIDDHLERPLDLAELADVAHFSAFHFHRLFAAWAGETLGDYVRRRRLEVAALRLATQPRLSVLEAAVSVGFGSGEAFSRAFRARFGSAPSSWRAAHDWSLLPEANSNPDQIERHGFTKNGPGPRRDPDGAASPEPPMNVELIIRPPVTIAYLRYVGPFGAPVGAFWGEQVAPWITRHRLWSGARYGISHDDPSITPPEQSRYDACVEVPEDFVPDGGFQKTVLPGGRYAALRFHGLPAEINTAWTRLLRDWLPGSGFQFDNRPAFEHYAASYAYDDNTHAFECDICIPIAPL
ncbi:GyrI-like domain-containing protein [Variovorax sp.]|jgi:AraC family transcriptional regulator|uniref:AraC family transcriptional regulator n=1 Tax=Variovorax TaxID=34072 RepID=UPI001ABCA739